MHKLFNIRLINYIYIILILSLWFCIDTNFENILSLKIKGSIKNVFLTIRSLGPFTIFIILLFLSFFYKEKIQLLTKNKALNIILIILYLNFSIQLFGLFIPVSAPPVVINNNVMNSYYIFVSLLSILAVSNLFNKNLEKVNYLISIIVLVPIVTIFGYFAYDWVLTTRNLTMYGTFPHTFLPLENFSSNVIRSSGLSRSAMILTIPLFYLILIDKIKFLSVFPYSRLKYLIPFLVLSTMIYLCQSRIVVLFFILFSFFSVFYFLWNKTIKYKIQKVFILIILPIIFFQSLLIIKEEIHSKFFTSKIANSISRIYNDNFLPPPTQIHELHERGLALHHYPLPTTYRNPEYPAYRKVYKKSFTSNRALYWKKIILESEKPILGYGALGDWFLITKNSSNILVYSYASGGIISSILMLVLILRYVYICLFLVFIKKIPLQKKNIFIFSSIFTISFLIYRGIGENSIAVFSIDLLVFLSCITICEKFKNQKYQ